ncbi:putative ATPase/DNA-binding winged helix-turn-helix (wHTH) protein [Duganella sp. 1224]|uniref:ATP-binding protein n=1 Tax=Duganella sp. 1224 TaxID=2587052 RepID=UPI0015CA5C2C|nr:winged helix-turn-helix domain-containing protein [Duganella sp. 1224]NYE59416.1 putative ATPase/DNA-binding winged helix-turn-helix (wHTH) protein [Duganella sp. 1224]
MTTSGSAAVEPELAFGPYRLAPANRTLLNDGRPVQLSGRAFDLLLALVERAGEVVSKEELIARVWPSTVVEENNLRVHIGTLRKVLCADDSGMRYVENVVGRGYSFVAPVTRVAHDIRTTVLHKDIVRLPLLQTRLIGRDQVRDQLTALVGQHRCVTIVGPGGIGKTTMALAVAEALAPVFGEHSYFLDLAPVSDGKLVASTVAVALGVPVLGDDPLPALRAFLRDKQAMLIFDSCEHVIDQVAALVEQLLTDSPPLHILATSREPLRADGERLHRLEALAVPPPQVTREDALSWPAVQLFTERAMASMNGLDLSADNLRHIVHICRRLDGIPLAIELAAGRADFFGIAGLSAQLDDCFNTLVRGRRTALPRHQTLRATLDWSFDRLPAVEQQLLQRFAIFRGSFTLEAAIDVVTCDVISKSAALDGFANLHAKSLLSTDADQDLMLYRLLDTTRAYAAEKLAAAGHTAILARRYAEYGCRLLANAQADWESRATRDWLAQYGRSIDHVRAGLDWAFGADGDALIGVRLTMVSAPLWYQLSLMSEYRDRLETALRHVAQAEPAQEGWQMQLHLALGHTLLHTHGGDAVCQAAFATTLRLADKLGDMPCYLRGLWGAFTDAIFRGDYAAALGYAEQFGFAAERHAGEAERVIHARLKSLALHYLGRQDEARVYADLVARHPLTHAARARNHGFQFDQRISSLAIQSLVLWMQGYPEQALRITGDAVREGQEVGHSISLCFALTVACSVATWSGARQQAQTWTTLLLDVSTRAMLPNWQYWGRIFQAAWLLEYAPDDCARESLAALEQSPFCGPLQAEVMASAHPALLTRRAVQRATDGSAGWCRAEILRHQAVLALAAPQPDAASAEALLHEALTLARSQGARGLELRAATTLAAMWRDQGRAAEAAPMLQAVYAGFTEGHDSRDLQAAAALLAGLRC